MPLTPGSKPKNQKERRKLVCDLFRSGKTPIECSKYLGVSVSTIWYILRRYYAGYKPPTVWNTPKNLASVKDTDLAYIAGIFDGEGCVMFDKSKAGQYIRVIIVNTNLEMLEHIAKLAGGTVRVNLVETGNRKKSWRWSLSYSNAIAFLDRIKPWLIVKSDQANLAFCWAHYRADYKNGSPETKKLILDTEQYIKECFRYLNRRGNAPMVDPIQRELDRVEWVDGEHAP